MKLRTKLTLTLASFTIFLSFLLTSLFYLWSKDVLEKNEFIFFAIGSFLIITTIFISYFMASSFSKPFEETNKAIIEAGKGNFSLIQNIKVRNDEYGNLIYSVQEMTKQVENLINEQAIKNRMTTLGTMAQGLAHEINNPLHLINNHSIIINRTLEKNNFNIENEKDKERIRKSLKSMNETIHRISHIISGLKSLTKENSKGPMAPASLNSILNTTQNLCKEKISNHEIVININQHNDDVIFDCYSGQLQHVLLNLINNSIDAIKNIDEKWINIDVSYDDYLQIKVTNSGPKISEEIIKNLFIPFTSNKHSYKGIGLGLIIAKQIINSHNGQIFVDVKSEHTCFVFQIPIRLKQEENFPIAA